MADTSQESNEPAVNPNGLEFTLERWERERGLTDGLPRASYVSTPITSGLRFLHWYKSEGHKLTADRDAYWRGLKADVILPNRQVTGAFVERLRWQTDTPIIDPSVFDMPDWKQEDYHRFWLRVLEKHVRRLILLDGWQFSTGCSLEIEHALNHKIDCVDQEFRPIDSTRAIGLLREAIRVAEAEHLPPMAGPAAVLSRIQAVKVEETSERLLFKDEVLDRLARSCNIAQFASFAPGNLSPRFSRIVGHPANVDLGSARQAIEILLKSAPEGKVNVRSFDPARPEGNPFVVGLERVEQVEEVLRNLGQGRGLYTIVNESINTRDGGVSGVSYRGVMEFAPDATPRVVDDPSVNTACLSFRTGLRMLEIVYGMRPALEGFEGARIEFSIHPCPRGWAGSNTIIWQAEQRPGEPLAARAEWPNAFSQLIGDKVYGLLLAHLEGFLVPRTLVFTRRSLFPFGFGRSTGSKHLWTRTAPSEKVPGFYPTFQEWRDPYEVLAMHAAMASDSNSATRPAALASVLVQEGVEARFSGRVMINHFTNESSIAGVAGVGADFMVGDRSSEWLPYTVTSAVFEVGRTAEALFGPLSMEWAFDGVNVWVLQLNSLPRRERSPSDESTEWTTFMFEQGGIEAFREAALQARAAGRGIIVVGNVSPLSHIGEIADILQVPVRFAKRE